MVDQGGDGVGKRLQGFKELIEDDGLEGVELELTGLGGEGDGEVVADDVESDLVDDLGDHGVDLARHDGGSRLHPRQIYLMEARTRAGRQ